MVVAVPVIDREAGAEDGALAGELGGLGEVPEAPDDGGAGDDVPGAAGAAADVPGDAPGALAASL